MAYTVDIETGFTCTIGDQEIGGRVRLATAAEKLIHAQRMEAATASEDYARIYDLVDQELVRALVTVDATVGGETWEETEDRARFVSYLPPELRQTALRARLGISALDDGAEGNSEHGGVDT